MTSNGLFSVLYIYEKKIFCFLEFCTGGGYKIVFENNVVFSLFFQSILYTAFQQLSTVYYRMIDISYLWRVDYNSYMMKKKSILDMQRITAREFKEAKKIPLVVVLDNLRSLNNVGSVFRTSDAFRVSTIYLCGITSTPPHPEIHKTALGAEDSVTWYYGKNTVDVIDRLHKDGYRVFAIEQVEESCSLIDLSLDEGKYAVVLGNEVNGVQQEVVDKCDACIEIPQYGTKHSLNVSVTAGLVIWDFFKQLFK